MGERGRARKLRMHYLQGREAAEALLRQTKLHQNLPEAERLMQPKPAVENPYPKDSDRWATWRAGFLSRLDPLGV
jgi:hypothetical protein